MREAELLLSTGICILTNEVKYCLCYVSLIFTGDYKYTGQIFKESNRFFFTKANNQPLIHLLEKLFFIFQTKQLHHDFKKYFLLRNAIGYTMVLVPLCLSATNT